MSNSETAYDRAKDTIINAKNPKVSRKDMELFHAKGYTYQQIASILGCSDQTVRIHLQSIGLQNNPARAMSYKNWDDLAFLSLYEQGMSDGDIGKALNVSRATVWRYRTDRGFPANKEPVSQISWPYQVRDQEDRITYQDTLDADQGEKKLQPKIIKPIPKEDWIRERVNDLSSYLQYQFSANQALDTELLAEYQQHTKT